MGKRTGVEDQELGRTVRSFAYFLTLTFLAHLPTYPLTHFTVPTYSGDENNRPQRTAVRKGSARQLLGS